MPRDNKATISALPQFAAYLLPSISRPFRRRQQSASSTQSAASPPSLSSSTATTPSSSPPEYDFLHSFSRGDSDKSELAFQTVFTPTPEPLPTSGKTRNSYVGTLRQTHPATMKCKTCSSDIAFTSQIVSKGFTGRLGRAYLVAPPPMSSTPTASTKTPDLVNTRMGRPTTTELLTGTHVVADVICCVCAMVLGWKYVDAKEEAQKYKVGKYILETKRVVGLQHWEDEYEDNEDDSAVGRRVKSVVNGECIWEDTHTGNHREYPTEEIVFDSEDEDECEDLFAGVWDPVLAAKRRGRRIANLRKAEMA
ncbi:yippee family protein [Xylogone sp. PMI_703]|nr:yippee family protein [Xylogone sp. PMI_703]